MKQGIHPNYVDCTITCACGNVIHTLGDTVISCCGVSLPALEAEAPDEELDEEPDDEPDEELDEPVDEPEAVAVPVAADSLPAVLLASP